NMALRHVLLIVLMSAASSTLAQGPQESQTSPEAPVAQDALVEEDAQPANAQTVQTKKTENPAEPESHGTRLHWQDIPKNVLHDQKAIFTSPFHINRENAKWWILFGAATGTLIANDQRISDTLPQKTFLTKPSTWASRIGADYAIYPLWATFYFVGKAGD